MDKRIAKLAAAGALVGLLGIGGISIASAQEDDSGSSTTTVQEQQSTDSSTDTQADALDREDCPDKAADQADASTEDAS